MTVVFFLSKSWHFSTYKKILLPRWFFSSVFLFYKLDGVSRVGQAGLNNIGWRLSEKKCLVIWFTRLNLALSSTWFFENTIFDKDASWPVKRYTVRQKSLHTCNTCKKNCARSLGSLRELNHFRRFSKNNLHKDRKGNSNLRYFVLRNTEKYCLKIFQVSRQKSISCLSKKLWKPDFSNLTLVQF